MTFAHYDFTRGASIHEHFHAQEEVYEVIEGGLEMTIEDETQIVCTDLVAIVPANVRHSVKALPDGRAIIVDYPPRRDFLASTCRWQLPFSRSDSAGLEGHAGEGARATPSETKADAGGPPWLLEAFYHHDVAFDWTSLGPDQNLTVG